MKKIVIFFVFMILFCSCSNKKNTSENITYDYPYTEEDIIVYSVEMKPKLDNEDTVISKNSEISNSASDQNNIENIIDISESKYGFKYSDWEKYNTPDSLTNVFSLTNIKSIDHIRKVSIYKGDINQKLIQELVYENGLLIQDKSFVGDGGSTIFIYDKEKHLVRKTSISPDGTTLPELNYTYIYTKDETKQEMHCTKTSDTNEVILYTEIVMEDTYYLEEQKSSHFKEIQIKYEDDLIIEIYQDSHVSFLQPASYIFKYFDGGVEIDYYSGENINRKAIFTFNGEIGTYLLYYIGKEDTPERNDTYLDFDEYGNWTRMIDKNGEIAYTRCFEYL